MGIMRFMPHDEVRWLASSEAVSPDVARQFTEQDTEGEIGIHHRGDERSLQLFEVRVKPDGGASRHAHEHDEIMYVLEGELRFGAHRLVAGSSVAIPARTLYSFRAGPDGATFLNFRPCLDASFLTAADLRDRSTERS